MNHRFLQSILSLIVIIPIILSACSTSEVSKDKTINPTTSISKSSGADGKETQEIKSISPSEEVPKIKNGNKKLLSATIAKNVDGDTVDINLNGKIE